MILEYMGRQWARFRLLWGRRWKPISIRRAIRSAERLLVCLPEEAGPKEEGIVALMEALSVREATVLCVRQGEDTAPGLEIFVLSKDDVGWFRLPRKALRRRIADGGFDVAIDLHRTFSVTSAYLCALSGATLRVGLGSGDDGTFFNMHYRGEGGYTPSEAAIHDICIGLARLFREIGGR